MSRVPFTVVAQNKVDGALTIVPFSSIEVKDSANTSYVDIYAAQTGGAALTQPGQAADSNGEFTFWAEEAQVIMVTVGGASVHPVLLPGITLGAASFASITGVYGDNAGLAAVIDGKASISQVDAFAGNIFTVSDGDVKFLVNVPFGGTINSVTTECDSGTCTATFKVNATALGGAANSVSSTQSEQAHVSSNTFSAGDYWQVTFSSNASCLGLKFTIKYTRSLAA